MTHREAQWIKYQMALKRITQDNVAVSAGCSQPMVSQVIRGRKHSTNVCLALTQALGYPSFEKLIEDYENHGDIA
jgi:transcriptional regulator with XRE-family HTH domain